MTDVPRATLPFETTGQHLGWAWGRSDEDNWDVVGMVLLDLLCAYDAAASRPNRTTHRYFKSMLRRFHYCRDFALEHEATGGRVR